MRMAEPSCRGKRGRQIPASALFEIILRGFEWSGAAARKPVAHSTKDEKVSPLTEAQYARRCIGLSRQRPMRMAEPSCRGKRGRQIPYPPLFL